MKTVNRANVICIPGAFTPTEILRAPLRRRRHRKSFPLHLLGPGYFRDILAPLPFLKLTPTGGVDAKNAGAWIKAGCSLCRRSVGARPERCNEQGRLVVHHRERERIHPRYPGRTHKMTFGGRVLQ